MLTLARMAVDAFQSSSGAMAELIAQTLVMKQLAHAKTELGRIDCATVTLTVPLAKMNWDVLVKNHKNIIDSSNNLLYITDV